MNIKCTLFDHGEVMFEGIKQLHLRINQLFCPRRPVTNADLYGSPDMTLYLRGKITETVLWERIIQTLGLNAQPHELTEAVRHGFTPVPGTMDIVRELAAAGHRLGILSVHGSEWIRDLDHRYGYHSYFDKRCISYSFQNGLMKPEPQAFLAAIARTRCLPRECLFIDDHLPNCETARSIGMNIHHFNGAQNLRAHLEALGFSFASAALPSG